MKTAAEGSGPPPVPTCTFDHQTTSVIGDDLYGIYKTMRQQGPTWSTFHGGFWMVTTYDHVRTALKDHATFSSASGCFLPDRGYRNLALEQDPPENTPFRNIFLSAVGRNAVLVHEQQLTEMIRRIVGEYAAAGGGDARELISEKVPVEGICLMLGLSPAVAARVRKMTTDAWKVMFSDPEALTPITEILLAEVAQRRVQPRDDFLTSLTTVSVDGSPLTDEQIGNILAGAVVAGHETTMNASSNLLYELASSPGLQRRLRESPDEIPNAVEECLRHRAPIHMFFRTVTRPTQLGEAQMSAGDKVALVYAAANRDPERFGEPDAFVAEREDVAHLSFGWGIHRCVGSFLAQTELRVLVAALLDEGDLTLETVIMAPLTGGAHMGMRHLELTLNRRGATVASAAEAQ